MLIYAKSQKPNDLSTPKFDLFVIDSPQRTRPCGQFDKRDDDAELDINPPAPCQIGKRPPAPKPKREPAGHQGVAGGGYDSSFPYQTRKLRKVEITLLFVFNAFPPELNCSPSVARPPSKKNAGKWKLKLKAV